MPQLPPESWVLASLGAAVLAVEALAAALAALPPLSSLLHQPETARGPN